IFPMECRETWEWPSPGSIGHVQFRLMSSRKALRTEHEATDHFTGASVIRGHKQSLDRDQFASMFVELAIKLAALATLIYVTLVLLRPFLSIVIWSVVLTVALYPLFDWLARQLGGRRRLAAILVTAVSLFIVLGPATWLTMDLVASLQALSIKLDLSA